MPKRSDRPCAGEPRADDVASGEYMSRAQVAVRLRDRGCVGCESADGLEAVHLIPLLALVEYVDAEAAHDSRLLVLLCQRCEVLYQADVPLTEAELVRVGELDSLCVATATAHFGEASWAARGVREMPVLYRLTDLGRAALDD